MTSEHRQPGQRAFLRRILAEGAARLGITPAAPAVYGRHDRTIGSAVTAIGLTQPAGAQILSRSYRMGGYTDLRHPVRVHVRRRKAATC